MSQSDQDRVRLAEAMGWHFETDKYDDHAVEYWWHKTAEKSTVAAEPPDPEHDANDDYAVLEWMRKDYRFQKFKGQLTWLNTSGTLSNRSSEKTWMYQIGDYARAALKVIPPTGN